MMDRQWLNETCDYSLLHRYECAHCMNVDDSDITPDHDYEVTAIFAAQFASTCTLNESHRIRKGDRVGKLQYADNPYISIPGVACKYCTTDYPRAKK